ncbi:type IV secretion system protein [Limimaricola sp. AA108-03]|uniref:type IV secretion system protein n=1 Tax=Limimaricola sp. AA108-03 TaxID=3425945 RepID=UPI003D78A7EB
MGVVTFFVETTDGFLDNAAETQFGMVAATVGTLGTVTCTLVVIFVFLNLAFGFRDMDGRMTFWLVVKMVLIAIFAQSWTQFSTFSSALLDGIDSIAGALVASVGGGAIGPSGTFAEEFDVLIGTMTEYLDAIADSMNWMTGAVINGIGLVLLSLLGGIAAFIVVFARVVMTLMLALAPIMIFLTLFDATKDYFLRWVSSTASFALYPVVVAGVFATIIGVGRELMETLGAPDAADNIGALVPFFMLILMSKAFILATPFLVRAISGNVVMPTMQAVSPDGARGFSAGLANTRGSQNRAERGARSDTELAGAATRHIATGAGAQVQRIMQRNKRLM